MKRLPIGLMVVMVLAWAAPAQAQWFFSKKQKPNPTQRVPELIVIVKTDADERKRTHAAEELREYDATVFTEIVPVLADVLLLDKKMNVRLEALNSLARIRPVSTTAGRAWKKPQRMMNRYGFACKRRRLCRNIIWRGIRRKAQCRHPMARRKPRSRRWRLRRRHQRQR